MARPGRRGRRSCRLPAGSLPNCRRSLTPGGIFAMEVGAGRPMRCSRHLKAERSWSSTASSATLPGSNAASSGELRRKRNRADTDFGAVKKMVGMCMRSRLGWAPMESSVPRRGWRRVSPDQSPRANRRRGSHRTTVRRIHRDQTGVMRPGPNKRRAAATTGTIRTINRPRMPHRIQTFDSNGRTSRSAATPIRCSSAMSRWRGRRRRAATASPPKICISTPSIISAS